MSSTLSHKADLAISSGSCTFIWHAPGLQAAHVSTLKHDGLLHTSRWNQNNRVVVTAGVSGQLALNYVTGTVMGVLPPQHDSSLPVVNTVCFSKGSKFLATGCANGEIKVWNLKRQNVRNVIKDHSKAVTSIHCSPDDKHFASSSLSGELWLHRVHDDGAAIKLPADGPIGKLCVQYSPLDAVLVSSSEDGSLNTWDTATCQAQDSYRMLHKAAASSVNFLTGSHVLASAGLDEQLMLLDRRSNSVAASVSAHKPLHSMACRDDGNTIAVGTSEGTVLLYDPRKLATPWNQTRCSGNEMIKDLHWQHTIASKSCGTAVKGGTRDSQSVRSSKDQFGVPLHTSAAPDHAAVLATPAPTSHATNAAMAVFSPLDTNVIPGFQYNNAGTPLSTFPNLGPRSALASWSKKAVDPVSALPAASLAGASKEADVQTAGLHLDLQLPQPQMSAQAETPTLTFPTPSFRPQQRTPTLTGPAVLQPESPRPMPAPGALPRSPMPASLPSGGPLTQANPALAPALPGSPVHGVWNSSRDSLLQPHHAATAAADGTGGGLADVAAELIAETPQIHSRLHQQPARQGDFRQEDVFDHRSLLNSAPESDAILMAVQQIVEDRLMSLREDMQASQQQVTGHIAQHQADLLHVVEALASKQDTMVARLDKLTDQLQQLLTKQASTMLL
ncbi:TPA: hypothetical protein ACH3X2_009836 [Trebouxia sp. C0005]